jgi:hypothetical protein
MKPEKDTATGTSRGRKTTLNNARRVATVPQFDLNALQAARCIPDEITTRLPWIVVTKRRGMPARLGRAPSLARAMEMADTLQRAGRFAYADHFSNDPFLDPSRFFAMAKKTIKVPHLRIDMSVWHSPAFATLDTSAAKLWLDLRGQYNGYSNGNIDATFKKLKTRGWASEHTLQRALSVLLERGLLVRTRLGKKGPAHLCSLYRFTDVPANDIKHLGFRGGPSTREFEDWTPPGFYELQKLQQHRCRNSSGSAAETAVSLPAAAAETAAAKNTGIRLQAAPANDPSDFDAPPSETAETADQYISTSAGVKRRRVAARRVANLIRGFK